MADRVSASLQKLEAPNIEQRLEAQDRLIIFTRQMEMLMHGETSVRHMAECFLRGDFHGAGRVRLLKYETPNPQPAS